ncbi:molybdenum cofactor biosynthesis protein MoaE [Fodinicurvata sediminis]|uniref:molybdenum cofactor biosynthesis protein MoaE n=1 Tax=Fodinicurvata sediminis TaxID=1121832 RepID=UPI0003B74F88|nr:molybdenum cofactor biosynthesis protein MoaE [Fodinicurvata sediminis]
MTVRIQEEDFDPGSELEKLTGGQTAIGGVTSFIGLVRDMAGDQPVTGMTLEHYPGMTEKMLERIEAEAHERWPLNASLIIHRVGPLEAGDRIVMVATASAHRQATFDSCHFLIDWLKTKAPFWKAERTREGQELWVEARESDDEASERWNR